MKLYKVETFVPPEALEPVKDALEQLGVGRIGNYDCCLSWYKVNSSWRPLQGATPYLGEVGKLEIATEYKIEFRCTKKDLKKVVQAIRDNHPFEEIGINVIELHVV